MELFELTDDLMLAGQIGPDTIPMLAAQGIRGIVCNRFDGEEPGQPDFPSIERAAAAHGIKAVYLPVLQPPKPISDAEGFAFGEVLEALPKPALAYCRTGSRSVILWGLSQAAAATVQGDRDRGDGRGLRPDGMGAPLPAALQAAAMMHRRHPANARGIIRGRHKCPRLLRYR